MDLIQQLTTERSRIANLTSTLGPVLNPELSAVLSSHLTTLDRFISGMTVLSNGLQPTKAGKQAKTKITRSGNAKELVLSAMKEWCSSGEVAAILEGQMTRSHVYTTVSQLARDGAVDRKGELGSYKYRAKKG